MRHHLNLHIDGNPRLSVRRYEGSTWLMLEDENSDGVAIFSDANYAALARAAEAFNAALAAPADEHKDAA